LNKTLIPLTLALACAFGLPAQAQSVKAKPAAVAKAKKSTQTEAKAPAEVPLAPADADQKTAAQQALHGEYACEFDQSLKISDNSKYPGYIDVGFKKDTWVMKPVLSSTGALRLEDVKGRMLMIQIANKSMVMDTKVGQRLVDGCTHERQREFAKTMAPADILAK
jgi:hypothetical protein